MNESNVISNSTALYGFIAESAQQNRFSAALNRLFKSAGDDAMMIPMNIREDDLYFTLSNMPRSHLKGAYIAPEYRAQLIDVLGSDAFYDMLFIKDAQLVGVAILPKAIKDEAKRLHVKRIAIIGSGDLAHALAQELEGFELAFFDPFIEDLMAMAQKLGCEIDINRMVEGMQVDCSGFDLLIDTGDISDVSMICALPANVLAPESTTGTLKTLCEAMDSRYIGYDNFLNALTECAYRIILEENERE